MLRLRALNAPTPFLFFTGKGGVGKTSLACATALALADRGLRVLLVSTDPASNLDEMLEVELSDSPVPVPNAAGLFAMNIDPEAAAESYRARVLDQLEPTATDQERSTIREQLSGACTTEIAAFDEFVGLLDGDRAGYDHIIFDTAPTGHTLRLLSLPKAWTGFLEDNDRGASCLGPHSGLKMQEERFRQALQALGDPRRTTVVLVTRADRSAIREAARTSSELHALNLSNQTLAVNGRFHATDPADAVAVALAREQDEALGSMPEALRKLPRDEIPLLGFDIVGLAALRAVLSSSNPRLSTGDQIVVSVDMQGLDRLIDEIAQGKSGLIMIMGKGGVGKTTVAAAVAVGLAKRGHAVHLSTTDPAAHVTDVVSGAMPGLTVDRIDPRRETERYVAKILASRGRDLDDQGKALLLEDLASPCTEEVAVFHAFSHIVAEARSAFVVLDTAPTGHTLLLLDATGAYHRQMTSQLAPSGAGRLITPLMRLQDSSYTRVILVTLPETTPVSEAAALQEDLRRADIEPFGWVINKCLVASGTRDPLLQARIARERTQIARVQAGLAKRAFILGWRSEPPVGIEELEKLSMPSSLQDHICIA
ncbi:Arsenical pump-driving ATPase (Arsenite-translocating ATPase) (Arsenical resistance ATPase) (Arsenite-transporting ATPase) [Bradyrhizobium sp. ORS 375]|uniref:arsenical pump-driving ATPase n=1 Tax=Bradyrhizobium sp. (strain ORS 375) TaxID=566679 RepID=UPI0002405ED0|nr:arsenical pump-driving ATPase [Bradyrhizobium sp. ORS 375]CCD95254.1 Arsenical pump-driving ATPase (Arsenite-translocating ATPase) (Arsenical resistance ATPase) (Arsenite-transporting ATPase) [Bradyrhizobium sp. ORS 375]